MSWVDPENSVKPHKQKPIKRDGLAIRLIWFRKWKNLYENSI